MPSTYTLLEHSIVPKSTIKPCEDALVLTEAFAAVIDGSTTPRAVGSDGRTSGQVARDGVVAALGHLPADAPVQDLLEAVAAHIAAQARAAGMREDLPGAVAAVYSPAWGQLWSVGDVHWDVAGRRSTGRRGVDEVAAQARAVVLRAALAAGADVTALAFTDPGRAATEDIRAAKLTFRNRVDVPDLGFAAFTGRQVVPAALVDVIDVPAGAQVVMASDGYLSAAASLELAEQELASALRDDPLCIGPALATKCPSRPGDSFDDRTYVRLRA